MRTPLAATLLLAPLLLAAPGCATQYIPNTDVEDAGDNRRVVEFCELYRRAVERKDIPTLLGLASPEYYENGGNVDASDDIDFVGLRGYLLGKFTGAAAIRYEIRYRRVVLEADLIYVDYTYSGSYRVATDMGEKWRSTVEENRLELVADGDSYRIVAGM